MTTTPDNPRALSADGELHSDGKLIWQQSGPDRKSDWPTSPDPNVVKLVLGERDKQSEAKPWQPVLDILASDLGLKHHFPHLTHLHLWGLPMEKLGPLPDGLKELDLRNSPHLSVIEHLPTAHLEVLVLWKCPELSTLPAVTALPKLQEFDLLGLRSVEHDWIHAALSHATQKLWKIDLSGSTKLRSLPMLLVGLRDLRANDCANLTGLPANWPHGLRRLELANTAIETKQFPKWISTLDYVNLAGTSKLTGFKDDSLPQDEKNFPRTLFLHGSGIRKPPAVLHGKGPEDNVAKDVFLYFQQSRQVGTGSIRRCKLLFLGNGQAGKTSLALSLEGDPTPAETAKRKGSTHGIRLQSRKIQPLGGTTVDPIRLDHWDFGGQEIYHNAHCKFVQSGSIFLLVWSQEQDGKDKAKCDVTGYEDILHPLRYWLDLVNSRTVGRGRVMIVASKHESLAKPKPLLALCNKQRPGYVTEDIPVKAYDSGTGKGQFSDIRKWICTNAEELVKAEGEEVPAHWQIAEEMVNRWLSEGTAGRTRDTSFEQFRDDFADEVRTRVAEDIHGYFWQLAEALNQENGFCIDDEITRQTLHVLTNLGALYWSEDLFDRRVIIGQDWALQGIYAALDRRVDSPIFMDLKAAQGRFTRTLLAERVWNHKPEYAASGVQDLLISFMEDCQICFRLSGERWDGHRFREPEYISIKHLPTVEELGAEGNFAAGMDLSLLSLHDEPASQNKHMNAAHWHAILADLGKAYGDQAQYALDGFYLPKNDKNQSALIRVKLDTSLEGESLIYVATQGPEQRVLEELKQEIVNKLVERLPDPVDGKLRIHPPGALKLAGDLSKKVTLFISYARNTDHTTKSDHYPYEDAINAIEMRLKGQSNIEILRDRNHIKNLSPVPGSAEESNVVKFMEKAAKAHFVLMVHSNKYWESQYCMFEAWKSYEALIGSRASGDPDPEAKFLLLDQGVHAAGYGATRVDMDAVDDYWFNFRKDGKLSAGLAGRGVTQKELSSGASNFLTNFYLKIQPNSSQREVWDPGKLDEIVEWIVTRCGFEVLKDER